MRNATVKKSTILLKSTALQNVVINTMTVLTVASDITIAKEKIAKSTLQKCAHPPVTVINFENASEIIAKQRASATKSTMSASQNATWTMIASREKIV